MTPLLRFVKRFWEKTTGAWYEGPEPPERLREMVLTFANLHPHATRAEWAEFATKHAGEAYRSGYQRGWEEVERDPSWKKLSPDQVAAEVDPDWRWAPAVELDLPGRTVLDRGPTMVEEVADVREQLRKRRMGS